MDSIEGPDFGKGLRENSELAPVEGSLTAVPQDRSGSLRSPFTFAPLRDDDLDDDLEDEEETGYQAKAYFSSFEDFNRYPPEKLANMLNDEKLDGYLTGVSAYFPNFFDPEIFDKRREIFNGLNRFTQVGKVEEVEMRDSQSSCAFFDYTQNPDVRLDYAILNGVAVPNNQVPSEVGFNFPSKFASMDRNSVGIPRVVESVDTVAIGNDRTEVAKYRHGGSIKPPQDHGQLVLLEPELFDVVSPKVAAGMLHNLMRRKPGTLPVIEIPYRKSDKFIAVIGSEDKVIATGAKYFNDVQRHLKALDEAREKHLGRN